jgi:Caspase domain/Domain of unknown function (DUF4384)
MSPIKRRHFLQSAAGTLAAIGLNQVDFLHQAHQSDRAFAQGGSRKFALLVGINDYREARPLQGCLTDVQLMQTLLQHRYGFNPANILTLTDAQATRQAILSAFETHLIQQAQPGDGVVFHFSGHGWMVQDPDPNPNFVYNKQNVNGTIIPYDWDKGEANTIRSIMGHTLFLLMSALKTENVTVILDSCHSGGGLRGNSTIRAFARQNDNQPGPRPAEEIAYQQQWITKLGLSEAQFKQRRKQGIAKGVGLGGATLQQEALDAAFDGFNAGAFTYTLTRYLWQLPIAQPLGTMYANLQLGVQLQSAQQLPVYEVKPGSQHRQQPLFFSEALRPAAEAVIRQVSATGEAIAWMGGASPNALLTYQPKSEFTVIDQQGRAIAEFVQTGNRQGLEVTGKLKSGSTGRLEPGMLLRQKIVGVPTDLKLNLGLDSSLGDALPKIRSQLSQVSWIQLQPMNAQQPMDYILGKMTEATTKQQSQTRSGLPPANAFSLFTAALDPIPEAFVAGNADPDAALTQLRPRLKSLLALRLLRTILGDTSPLKVSAEILPVDEQNQPLAKTGRSLPSRGLQTALLKTQEIATTPLKLGNSIGVRVKNSESKPLYVAALVISDTGELLVLFPFGFEAPDDASLVKAKQEMQIPVPFKVAGTPGYLELLILASREPLRNSLLALQSIARSRGVTRGQAAGLDANETDTIVGDLLGDIDKSSRGPRLEIPPSFRAFDSGKLAALSAVFQVVE